MDVYGIIMGFTVLHHVLFYLHPGHPSISCPATFFDPAKRLLKLRVKRPAFKMLPAGLLLNEDVVAKE